MDKSKARELINTIMAKVDEMLGQEQMEHFVDQYDLKTVQPKPEYEAKLMKVKEDLARMGVPYN